MLTSFYYFEFDYAIIATATKHADEKLYKLCIRKPWLHKYKFTIIRF